MAEKPETWESLLQKAMDKQQEYYELLADWLIYGPDEKIYCKQNIGFALYGPPTTLKKCITDGENLDINITEAIEYTPEEKELINKIYTLIDMYGNFFSNHQVTTWIGIIFNVVIPTKEQMIKSPERYFIGNFPVFKIKNRQGGMYKIMYIDHTGRFYKSWTDYLKTNTLPECTMIVPLDGTLQSDEEHTTIYKSIVKLDVLKSPMCSTKNKVLKKIDIATSVTSLTAGVGLAASTLFFPVAPVVVMGVLGVNVLTGAWTFGRSANRLRDRSNHKESIGLDNMDSASAWLGIAGSTIGVATSGGTVLLSRAAQQGRNISMAAKAAYNSTVVCNFAINGFGTLFQCYNIYEKYKKTGKVTLIDVVSFGAHLLFFANSVVNVKFAKDIILSSQGKVIEEYRSGLSKARHRNAYNRMVRKIKENNLDPVSQSTEITRRINMKGSTRNVVVPNTMDSARSTTKSNLLQFKLQFDLNAISINGIKIMNPMMFIKCMLQRLQSGLEETLEEQSNDSELNGIMNNVFDRIDFYFKPRETGKTPTQNDINSILSEITSDQDVLEIVRDLFKIMLNILIRSESISDFFTEILRLLYIYLCINACNHFQTSRNPIENCTLRKTLIVIAETLLQGADSLINEILEAFNYYLKEKEKYLHETFRSWVS